MMNNLHEDPGIKKHQQIYNPFLPLDEYIPDGEPHVFGGRVYLFGSHDREGGTEYCELDYVAYSAPVDDLTNWRYEGYIYSSRQDPDYSPTERYMYAPDVVQGNDGRYYLYYNLQTSKAHNQPLSVAVCDTPAGKYAFYGHVKNHDGSPFLRCLVGDPALINDEGIIRLYYGWSLSMTTAAAHGDDIPEEYKNRPQSDITIPEGIINAEMMVFRRSREEIEKEADHSIMGANTAVLADDMLTVKEGPARIVPGEFTAAGTSFEGHAFYEASSIRRINGLYYFIYSSQLSQELCYAVSKYPDRDFIYGGTIISNGDEGYRGRKPEDRLNMTANNHGSVECVNGKWYVFYHRHTHNSTFSRQACAEPVVILPDGTIPQVEISSCGLNGGPLAAQGEYPAVIACNITNGKMPQITNRVLNADIPFVTHDKRDRYITGIKDGVMIGYKYFAFNGPMLLTIKTRGNGEGSFRVTTDTGGLGEIKLTQSDTWNDTTALIEAYETAALYLTYHGSGSVELLSIRFGKE
ncbi:hypothetical protein FACS189450_05720 [Spirochaetia bacterium]|nr:hypothetical protein FACS189450_05720 [Spirochaetia bacterium]